MIGRQFNINSKNFFLFTFVVPYVLLTFYFHLFVQFHLSSGLSILLWLFSFTFTTASVIENIRFIDHARLYTIMRHYLEVCVYLWLTVARQWHSHINILIRYQKYSSNSCLLRFHIIIICYILCFLFFSCCYYYKERLYVRCLQFQKFEPRFHRSCVQCSILNTGSRKKHCVSSCNFVRAFIVVYKSILVKNDKPDITLWVLTDNLEKNKRYVKENYM